MEVTQDSSVEHIELLKYQGIPQYLFPIPSLCDSVTSDRKTNTMT